MSELHLPVGAHRRPAAHDRAGDRRRRRDGDRAGAGHGVVQHAHREDARQQVDRSGRDLFSVRRGVGRGLRDKGELGRVRALLGRLLCRLHQTHGDGTVAAHRFGERQDLRVAVDVALQLRAREAKPRGIDEDRGIAGIDQGCLDRAHARYIQHVDPVAGREHPARSTLAIAPILTFVGGGIEELEPHLGGGKGHAVEFEAAQFDHLAVLHRHAADDPLPDVGLPDTHRRLAVAGAAIMPMLIAKGPTAVVRLPQLPDQSITGASIATCPKR